MLWRSDERVLEGILTKQTLHVWAIAHILTTCRARPYDILRHTILVGVQKRVKVLVMLIIIRMYPMHGALIA